MTIWQKGRGAKGHVWVVMRVTWKRGQESERVIREQGKGSEWVIGEQEEGNEWVTGEQGEGSKRVMSVTEMFQYLNKYQSLSKKYSNVLLQ